MINCMAENYMQKVQIKQGEVSESEATISTTHVYVLLITLQTMTMQLAFINVIGLCSVMYLNKVMHLAAANETYLEHGSSPR